MAETIGLHDSTLKWNCILFDTQDMYLLLIDGVAINYNEYNQRTGVITNEPIPVSTAGSASDDANRQIYLVTAANNLAIYDIDTKLFINNLTIAPTLLGGGAAGAFNPNDGLLYFLSTNNAILRFASVDPITGVRGPNVAKPTIPNGGGQSNGTALAISPTGRFYWPNTRNIGGGQWQARMYSWTLAQPAPVLLHSQNFPNPLRAHNGATYQIDNKIYISDAANDVLWSYNIDSNTFNSFEDNITNANSMGAYTLGPLPGICFQRTYEQDLEGNVTFQDTNFDGTPYNIIGGANCFPIGLDRSYITQDRVLTTGDTLTIPANTNRSMYLQPITGTVDINGSTLPTTSIFNIEHHKSETNHLCNAYTIDNITGTTYLLTTRYV